MTAAAAPRTNALPILIAASVMMSLAMGMRQCLGLFLPPMTQALAMSASDFTFAIAVQNVVWGLAQAPLGAIGDRWGLRPVMVLGAFAYVAAMTVMTAATGVSMFVLAQTLIGIGATSIGRTPSGYVQNIVETGAWARAVAAGNLPVARGHALTQQDNLRAHVIERIMCDLSVDLAGAGSEAGCGFETALTSLRPLADQGLVEIADRTVRITERGRPYLRLVAAAFDAYLPTSKSAHSRAV